MHAFRPLLADTVEKVSLILVFNAIMPLTSSVIGRCIDDGTITGWAEQSVLRFLP